MFKWKMFKWFKNHGNTQIIRNDALTIDSRSFWIQYFCVDGIFRFARCEYLKLEHLNSLELLMTTLPHFDLLKKQFSAANMMKSTGHFKRILFLLFFNFQPISRTLRWKWFVLGIQRFRRNYGTKTDQTHAYHESHIQPLSHFFFFGCTKRRQT